MLEGNKARLVVIFRGREIVHPETGQAMLKKVVELTSDIAMVEQPPMMEGRRMLMIISPRGGVINRPPGAPGASPGTRASRRRRRRRRRRASGAVAAAPSRIRRVTGAGAAPRPAVPSRPLRAPRPASGKPAPKPAASRCRSSLPQSNRELAVT